MIPSKRNLTTLLRGQMTPLGCDRLSRLTQKNRVKRQSSFTQNKQEILINNKQYNYDQNTCTSHDYLSF